VIVETPSDPHVLQAFVKNFSDTGTMDTTPYLCVPAALKWRERIQWGDKQGDEAIKGYIQNLAREGGAIVAKVSTDEQCCTSFRALRPFRLLQKVETGSNYLQRFEIFQTSRLGGDTC